MSEASAAARDAGGVMINGRDMIDAQKWYQVIGSQSGLPQYYLFRHECPLTGALAGLHAPFEMVPRQDAYDRFVRRP